MKALVELHVHLEGSVPPVLLRELAARHGQPGVVSACLAPDGERYRPCGDFAGFLRLIKAVCAVLRTPSDYHAAALALGNTLADNGIVYAEVIVGYGILQRDGRTPLPYQRALAEAAAAVAARRGVRMAWLPDSVRQWGPDAAWRDLEAAVAAGPALGVVGYGVGGDERAAPAAAFAPVLAAARGEGLGTTLHAGETGSPEAVRDAVLAAGVDRVGHALAAAAAPALLQLLRETETFVELCPGSNVATGVVPDRDAYPLAAFLDAGVRCCLNTDDPALFGLTLRGEYAAVAARGLAPSRAAAMQRDAVAAAFLPAAERQALQALLEEGAASPPGGGPEDPSPPAAPPPGSAAGPPPPG